MSISKPQKEDDGLEVTYRIPVERFQYADELNEQNNSLKRKNRILTGVLAAAAAVCFVFGWGVGSFTPIPFVNQLRQGITAVSAEDADKKIESVLRIMENYWYFSREIENLDERLSDQALKGVTDNEEDPHTEYMSREEISQFTQAINRNFVGIGVQFRNTESEPHVITRVFRDSPAEKAGVLPGDIIHLVDGVNVDDMNAQEIKDLVQGEEGTIVSMTFLRGGEPVTLNITRGQVYHTVDGNVTDEGFGYLSIQQFGESTGSEVKEYLDEFKTRNVTRLIIDLRDDGGGYLDALKSVLNCFLPADTVFIRREYTDGKTEENRTSGGLYPSIDGVVLLVNGNTASAAEAFTMAMREMRKDVRVIGTKTYGKGSVQITRYFDDGTALKYTDSIWKSPRGIWVNNTGIVPDETVELHPVLDTAYTSMEEGTSFRLDDLGETVKTAALCLDFLGYTPVRTDGYFDASLETALKNYQKDNGMEETGILDTAVYDSLVAKTIIAWNTDPACDRQRMRAVEILKNHVSEPSAGTITADHSADPVTTEAVMMESIADFTIRNKDRNEII